MRFDLRIWMTASLALFLLPVAHSQDKKNPSKAPGTDETLTSTSTPPPIVHHTQVLGDYVPCLFEEQQEFSFRSLPYREQAVTEAQEAILVSAFDSGEYGDGLKGIVPPSIIGEPYAAAISNMNAAIAAAVAKKSGTANTTAAGSFVAATLNNNPVDWPDDVSCSFSFLMWKETSDVFGRRVANQYVALQVNIRNLSPTSEFLIHDIQVAVDSLAPESYFKQQNFSRFQTTRDKLIVRAVAQRGQTEDRRNLILNVLTMAGGIGGGVNAALQAADAGTALATNYSTGVAIFQGSFLPGFANIFPDHTLEHINHINDMSFSASSTSKTIVPIQGSVPLITFISEKPLEQIPVMHCGGRHDDTACNDALITPALSSGTYYKPISYKNWKPEALKLLQSRTYVVLGGVHINESGTTATLDQLNCPVFSDGAVDLSQIANNHLTCPAKGTHLSKAVSLTLTNNASPSAKPISGTVSASADGTTAQVQFAPTDVASASGKYAVTMIDAAGNSSTTQVTVTFPSPVREPAVTAFTPVTLTANTAATVTLTGTNLDRLSSLTLTPAAGAAVTLSLGSVTASTTSIETISGSMVLSIPATAILNPGTYTFAGTSADGTMIAIAPTLTVH